MAIYRSNSKVAKVVVVAITFVCCYFTVRNRHYVTSSSIPPADNCPWTYLLHKGNNSSFIELTGFSRKAFFQLHDILFDTYEPFTKGRKGRPSSLDSYGKLDLFLHYVNSTMRDKTLCQIFGTSPSTISRVRSIMCLKIVAKLKRHKYSRVAWPNKDVAKMLKRRCLNKFPLLRRCIGTVDGLAILTFSSIFSPWESQNLHFRRN